MSRLSDRRKAAHRALRLFKNTAEGHEFYTRRYDRMKTELARLEKVYINSKGGIENATPKID